MKIEIDIPELKYQEYKNYNGFMNYAEHLIKNGTPIEQEPKTEWIPVSERLPETRDWYLGVFKEPDTGWINPLPFVCDYVGRETKATTKEFWIIRGYTDRDECIEYYYNLECVAWQPLPEPYRSEVNE